MVKIYGTLGPACQDEKILTEMFALGMTGMRLNLSHVTLAESGELIGKMKWAAESCGVKPQLLIDLQGPELRTGAVAEPILLKKSWRSVRRLIGRLKMKEMTDVGIWI